MSRSRIGVAISVGATLLLTTCGGDGGTASADPDCTPEHQFETVTEGTLTVGLVDLPPYAMTRAKTG